MRRSTNVTKRLIRIGTIAGWISLACTDAVGPSVAVDASIAAEESDGIATEAQQPICDGSNRLRLRFYTRPSEVVTGGAIYIENGNRSFAVDGTCRYWINGGFDTELDAKPLSYARPWRTGLLPEELRQELDAALDLEHLEKLSSCPFNSAIRDVSVLRIRSEYSRVACQGIAEVANTEFGCAWAIIGQSRLYADGTDLDGPMRVVGYPTTANEFIDFLEWPLSVSVTNYHVDMALGSSSGSGLLVADVDDVTRLRLLRQTDMNYREAHPEYQVDGVYVQDGEEYAVLHLRDAIPYEDERGLLPFSE